jgi:hypothetical protein
MVLLRSRDTKGDRQEKEDEREWPVLHSPIYRLSVSIGKWRQQAGNPA